MRNPGFTRHVQEARHGGLEGAWLRGVLFAGALAALPTIAAADGASTLPAVGVSRDQATARAPGDGRVLYREQHLLRRDAGGRPLERIVLYRCPGGDAMRAQSAPVLAFARKRLDYRASTIAPRFVFEDARSGYREGLHVGAPPRLFVVRRTGAAERADALRTPGAVVDAGFDEFVRAHWDALAAGRTLPLDFALPSRLRSYRFTVARTGAGRIGGVPVLRLRLQLSGLLAWVAPHVDASYDLATRRLLRFEGPGTIRDVAGEAPVPARIDFEGAITAATEADWRAALAAPLSACADGQRADAVTVSPDTARRLVTR
jgi:hypothetical protein